MLLVITIPTASDDFKISECSIPINLLDLSTRDAKCLTASTFRCAKLATVLYKLQLLNTFCSFGWHSMRKSWISVIQ